MLLIDPWRPRQSPIGLDWGTRGFRAVQLARRAGGYALQRSLCHPFAPAGSGDDAAHVRRIAQLRDGLRAAGFRGRRVATAVDTDFAEFHMIEVPEPVWERAGAESDKVVQWEVSRLVTAGGDKLETRHWRLPRSAHPGPNAIAVTADREQVIRLVDTCAGAGLVCTEVDTHATALCRFGSLLRDWPARTVWSILDLGYRNSRLIVCMEGTPILIREPSTGGKGWTGLIASTLNISAGSANTHKERHGLMSPSSRGATDPPDGIGCRVSRLMTDALQDSLNELASEIKKSYEYVLGCIGDCRAADLILVGGGAALKHLPETLGNKLGIPVLTAATYLTMQDCRLSTPTGVNLEQLALAVGLAMGGVLP